MTKHNNSRRNNEDRNRERKTEASDSKIMKRFQVHSIHGQIHTCPFFCKASRVPHQLRVPREMPAPFAHRWASQEVSSINNLIRVKMLTHEQGINPYRKSIQTIFFIYCSWNPAFETERFHRGCCFPLRVLYLRIHLCFGSLLCIPLLHSSSEIRDNSFPVVRLTPFTVWILFHPFHSSTITRIGKEQALL